MLNVIRTFVQYNTNQHKYLDEKVFIDAFFLQHKFALWFKKPFSKYRLMVLNHAYVSLKSGIEKYTKHKSTPN